MLRTSMEREDQGRNIGDLQCLRGRKEWPKSLDATEDGC